ncbi:L,D-transpeptidase family protein [Acidimangrovimonas pyrenivorans]|uniref:Murein L,D-transpeptidase n=1 Tax=Acidimangrovimonas pyrenivorans TaxID=2030798 RepID=A0ABV7AE62_9RHOB
MTAVAMAAAVTTGAVVGSVGPAMAAQELPVLSPFRQAIAAAAGSDRALAAFYQARDYEPLWTGRGDARRREAFFRALSGAGAQGLPVRRYDPAVLARAFREVRTERDRDRLEVLMSEAFLQYAHDVQTGVLTPSKVDPDIKRKAPLRDRRATIEAFAKSSPAAFLAQLPPHNPDYDRLLKAKLDMERLVARGGWGPTVPDGKYEPGDSGRGVIALRNRLVAMGYLGRTASARYDGMLQHAVQLFQADHGLNADGVAGRDTVRALNVSARDRLKSIIVAMERLRWMNMDLGKRYVWVNEADFTARVVDDGKTTFETRAVVGKNGKDTRSPEFSDQIEFMVVNPTWNVPRSIVTKEYLPMLQKNPNAVSYLKLINSSGQTVSRDGIDFTQFTAQDFPFELKQPPSARNALGLVKFMFPNRYNIYLHDTPTKYLFKRDTRAYSHGCIRLNDPFDFAYTLLRPQTSDPKGVFKAALATGVETILNLKKPVPVHLVYFTAWPTARGTMTYRRDIYGRDAEIFDALAKAGVALDGVQG